MTLRTAKIISVLITVTGALVLLRGATFEALNDNRGYQPPQPISFSHKLHAGDNRIPCLYCHWAAEKSSVAGIPAASLCMNCHSQVGRDSPEVQKIARAMQENRPIEWVRIHDLPDFTRFNHSRHVWAGIRCQECHGPVETMERVYQFRSLSMGMCVGCHRTHRVVTVDASGAPIITREATRKKLMASTDCSVCHY